MSEPIVPRTPEVMATDALASGLTEVLRLVHFSDVDEWLEELALQATSLRVPWVRVTASFRWDPQLSVMQHVTARAGFWGGHEYVELTSYCGQRMSGAGHEAIERWEGIRAKILATCEGLGIEVRAGRYDTGRKEG